MIEADVLIRNCRIITMDSKRPFIEKGFIAIRDKRIVAVDKQTKALSIQADDAVNGKGKIALPGLINCHTHVAMTLFRGLAEDRLLDAWLRETIWPLEAKLKPSHIYDGSLLGCLEMIKSGTTCFADMYFHEDTVARAVQKVGLRAVLAEGIIEAGDRVKGGKMFRDSVRISKLINGYANGRVSARLGPHAVYSCSPDLLSKVRIAALKLNVGVNIHLAEAASHAESLKSKYGLNEVELLQKTMLLDDLDIIAAHCIHLNKDDMCILAKHGVKVAYNPVANMKLGMGVPRIQQLLKLGITCGLGTDGPASNNSLDMFETMKVAALLQKSYYLDPTVLPAETVLRMATIEGAKVLGLERQIGSLQVGKRADIILMDFAKPHLTPRHNIYANIVYAAHGSDVDTVIVDGNILMENREVRTLEEEKVMEKAQHTASSITT